MNTRDLTEEERRHMNITATVKVTAAVLAVVVLTGWLFQRPGDGDLPKFNADTPAERKQEFFTYLRPIVSELNDSLLERRARLDNMAARLDDGRNLNWRQRGWLRKTAKAYGVDSEGLSEAELVEILLRRVDMIPESLVLVQAAKESGWGRSRFAQEGNNLFGERCFIEGCGLVPEDRPPGQVHELQTFPTVRASVQSYLHNLNSHDRYRELRDARETLRDRGAPLTGLRLADYLDDYSERGKAYVEEVKGMILRNGLEPVTVGT